MPCRAASLAELASGFERNFGKAAEEQVVVEQLQQRANIGAGEVELSTFGDGLSIDSEPLGLHEDLVCSHMAGSQVTAFVDLSEPMGESGVSSTAFGKDLGLTGIQPERRERLGPHWITVDECLGVAEQLLEDWLREHRDPLWCDY